DPGRLQAGQVGLGAPRVAVGVLEPEAVGAGGSGPGRAGARRPRRGGPPAAAGGDPPPGPASARPRPGPGPARADVIRPPALSPPRPPPPPRRPPAPPAGPAQRLCIRRSSPPARSGASAWFGHVAPPSYSRLATLSRCHSFGRPVSRPKAISTAKVTRDTPW